MAENVAQDWKIRINGSFEDQFSELQRLRTELQQEREDARRIIGLRQDRIDVLTAELGNVRTQWNRMRIAKERAEAKNAALEARLDALTKQVTDEQAKAILGPETHPGDMGFRLVAIQFAHELLFARSQQAPASEETQ